MGTAIPNADGPRRGCERPELERLVQTSLDCLDVGITIFDRGLRLVLTNRRFLELRDIPERLGRIGTAFEEQIRFRALRGDYGPGEVNEIVRQHVELARRFEPHCVERVRNDGTVLEIRGNPIPGGGFVAIYTDITERKRAEQALLASEEELKVRVAEREDAQDRYEHLAAQMAEMAEDLDRVHGELEVTNLAKSEFLANVSHELRTPLNAILGFSELIAAETFGPLGNPQYADYANDIRESGAHLLALINDILDLSKVEAGKEVIREEEIDVAGVLRTVRSMVKDRAAAGGIALDLDCPDALPRLRADRRKLIQVLINLLSNGIKFTPNGGSVRLKTWFQRDSGYVFQVVDTGIGISLDDIPKALSVFGQVENAFSRTQKGTGLGLPLTKSLVELHGGCLDLQSEVGAGTTVTVRFPAERIVNRSRVVPLPVRAS